MTEQEYIIMASGEIITQEHVAAWAAASSPPRSTESLLAEILDTGWLVPVEDYFSAESTPSSSSLGLILGGYND